MKKRLNKQISVSVAVAKSTWGPLNRPALDELRELLRVYRFSVVRGHLKIVDGSGTYPLWLIVLSPSQTVRRDPSPAGAAIL